MKRKSFGLLSIIIAGAAAISITVASCDNSATDPVNPGKGGGGKTPEVLTGGAQSVGVSLSGLGGTNVESVPDVGDVSVSGFSGTGAGIRSTFGSARITTWSQSVDGGWPIGGTGGVNLRAFVDANQASNISIQQEGENLRIQPTFTGGGAPTYRMVLYNGATAIATVPITVGTPAIISPSNVIAWPWYPCCWIRRWGFGVHPWWGYCYWNLYWGPCCWWRYWWNGNWWYFNRVAFLEGIDNTHYPYADFNQIDVTPLGSGVNALRISDETARP